MNISGHLLIEDLLVETLMKVLKFKFSLILREVHAVLSLIFKKGDIEDIRPTNYRPISLTNVINLP